MKHTKKMGKRILASVLSASVLAVAATSQLHPVETVNAASTYDYGEALELSLYMFDANQCGCEVDDNCLTWRGNCHTYDAKASVAAATNLKSEYKSLVDPDGDGYVDLSGGYHDAGDHVKFNLTMGFAASSLAMSYYLYDGIYDELGCRDHLEYILRNTADYLMKTTFLNADGSVATICYQVSDISDHNVWTTPESQIYDRGTYWMSASNNNSIICGEMAAALAGTAYVMQDSDPAYAAKCLEYAKAIYTMGKNNKGNEQTGNGGMYGTADDDQDELLIAQTWLWLCGEDSQPSVKPSNGQYNGQYDYYLYSWDKVYQGYAAMMYKATKDSAFASELQMEYNNQGGLSSSSYNTKWGWGNSRYNCAVQMVAIALANGDANSSYAQGAKFQMDYILGNNSYNYSFLVGYGDSYPTHYHHRAANPGTGNPADNTACKYVVYGALIGGPDDGGYQDHQNEYKYTEPALDYNACFALACGGLYKLYGGSADAADKVAANASEITYPFSFGSSTPTPQPTTEPIEPTTEPIEPTTEPIEPTTEHVEPTTDPVEPTTEPVEPTTDPVEPTSPQPDPVVKELEMSSDGRIDVTGIDKLIIKLNSTSGDTESNGGFNEYANVGDQWPKNAEPTLWSAPVSNNEIVVEYDVPDGVNEVQFMIWWPTTATVTTIEGTSTSTTPDPTQTPDPTPAPNVAYGDVDENGDVNIMDVILLNRNLMIGAEISAQGMINADVDNSGDVDAVDSLNILKAVVKLVTLPV